MKKTLVALGIAASAMSAPALAQMNTSNLYIGAGLGQSKFADSCSGLPAGFSCDEKDTAFKLFAGYQFNRNFAAEIAYQDFGKTKASGTVLGLPISADVKSHAFEADALGMLPFANQFAAYGRLGLYYAKTEGSGAVAGTSASGSDTNTGVTYGLGLQWDAVRNVGLRLEWQRYHDVGGDNSGKGDIDVLGIAALYRFR